MNTNTSAQSLLLEIDYDGLIIPLERRLDKVDLQWLARSIATAAQQFGHLTEARAYACWNKKRYGRGAAALKHAGIDPVTIQGQAKNQADTEIIRHIYGSVPYFGTICLVTNDEDLLPGIEAVREAGKTISLMFWPESANKRLLASVPPHMRLSLEDVLGLGGPHNQPQSVPAFSLDEQRSVLITAEMLLRRRHQNWLPYQVLIEALMPQYTYRAADLLIRDSIAHDMLTLECYGIDKKSILFINHELPQVKNTIHLLDVIVRTIDSELETRALISPEELTRVIAQMYVINQLGENPQFWFTLLLHCGILQQRTRRMPGSLTLGLTLELNRTHPGIQRTQYQVAIAA